MTYKITGFQYAKDTGHSSDVPDGTLIAFPHPHFFLPPRSIIFYLGGEGLSFTGSEKKSDSEVIFQPSKEISFSINLVYPSHNLLIKTSFN
jgi:hypothetical protein